MPALYCRRRPLLFLPRQERELLADVIEGLVLETEFLARAPVADPLLQAQQTCDEVRVCENVVAYTL